MIRQNTIVENLITINSNIIIMLYEKYSISNQKKIESYIHQNIHATIDSHIPIDSLNKIMNNFRLNYFLK